MKLFSRGNTNAAAAGPASAVAPPAEAVAAGTPPSTAPEPKQGPDVAELLESSVKDISEKVARLASTVESSMDERASIDAKLSQMEDRMRKLSSLTEMISAQYNPFIGDAPPQREPLPEAETGLASPPLAAAAPSGGLDLDLAPPGLGPAMADPLLDGPGADFGAPPEAPHAPSAAEPARDMLEATGVRVERFSEDFQSSLLLLKWADLLLQNAQSREGVSELLGYYHNVGWLGDVARDQLQAYVDGIAHDGRPEGEGEWRATAEFHEVSLLFLERLRNLARGAR